MDNQTRQRQRTNNYHRSSTSPYPYTHNKEVAETRQVSSSSTWKQLVAGASTAAGTTAAVLSEESMKCMKYCLSWLQYAIKHIEQQMELIRSYLVSQANHATHALPPSAEGPSPPKLSSVRKDVANTLKKVVDVISKYAGASLPHHARLTVRGFIVNLPSRWVALNDLHSTTTSPATSPRQTAGRDFNEAPDRPKQEDAAVRLLNFGQESVDMLQSVSNVFSDTVTRAEAWKQQSYLTSLLGKSTSVSQDLPSTPSSPLSS
ncbi:hypothetical protein DM01DRAFT_1404807 [Hesseltinella vesiculosa]|uniref:Opi1-domain-containing protein n=1 Tax=Hesseltinella vesiculosa TaxID=101127 RepID=A0A1X2GSX4_9FUNG|nr:hypothetical protein DM01DRAFT_1404807 [Hesseltinella vesiculosa]